MDIKYIDITRIKKYFDMHPEHYTSKHICDDPIYDFGFLLAIYYKNKIFYWWYSSIKDVLYNEKLDENFFPCTVARSMGN